MSISSIPAIGLDHAGASVSANGHKVESGFARTLNDVLGGASKQDAQAGKAVEQLALGQTDNIHGVAMAAAKADLSLRLVVEIRNRLQEAYQEVMRMQV